MFIKHINCFVIPENRLAFSETQKAWFKTKESKGFICQIGGWNQKNQNEAVIISFWEDKSSLDSFMNKSHDDIFYQNKQSKTYYKTIISHFECTNLEIEKTIFINEIDIVENLITTNAKQDTALKIDFANDTFYINGQNLKNEKISLIDSWKVI